MKIVFFGDSQFSAPTRNLLPKNGYEISFLIGKKTAFLENAELFNKFVSLVPDLCLVADFGRIIPKKYIEIPKHGFLNIHPSLLPKYRGPSPIQSAILNGDNKTGVSLMLLDEEIDHGPILKREIIPIHLNDSYSSLYERLADLGAKLLLETLPFWVENKIQARPQDHTKATYTKIFSWIDGKINWHKPADEILNQIRALNPEPGTWTLFNDRILKIIEADILPVSIPTSRPGFVKKINNMTVVETGKGFMLLETVQLEGKKELPILDFLNGCPNFILSTLD